MADEKPTPPDADQTGSDGYWIHDPGGPSRYVPGPREKADDGSAVKRPPGPSDKAGPG